MQKVIVLNRDECIKLTYQDFSLNRVIISISNMKDDYPKFNQENHSIKDILYCKFDDEETGPNIITNSDAKRIVDFVTKYKDMDQIVVHCSAGISRSAGVAAAILKYLTNDDTLIFDNPKYCPNMKCYFRVLQCFCEVS